MKLSYIYGFGNKGNIFAAESISKSILQHQEASQINQPNYLTPDYFLPSSSNAHYYSRKYSGNLNFKSKFRNISRVASVMLLSLGFLATTLEVEAKPNLETASSSYLAQSSYQQPKKKSILKRAAHKVSKRLGFSQSLPVYEIQNSTSSLQPQQPEITLSELQELYAAEYGESMDATISRGEDKSSGLAEALKKSLALREKTLERRKAEDIFTSEDIEDIYSKPVDAISIASGSSTEYEEPWQEPEVMIGEAFTSEFTDIKQIEPSAPPLEFSLPKQVEPSAPPLSASNSIEDLRSKDLNLLSNEESKAIELIDQAIEDSGYSSPSISSSPSVASSPTNEVEFQGGYETDISNCSFDDTSSTEYDTEAEIRAYENVEVESQNKKLKTRKARNARAAGARYSSRDIEQGLAELHSDTDFSDESSGEESASGTDGYDTVYTSSSSSEHSYDDGLCPSNCVNFIEPLNSTLKFDHKMSHVFIPIWDRHGPFFGNIINCQI